MELAFALFAVLGAAVWYFVLRGPSPPSVEVVKDVTVTQPSSTEPALPTVAPEPDVAPRLERVEGRILVGTSNDQPHSGVLVVARFEGATTDRDVLLFDASNGRLLWRLPLPGGETEAGAERAWSGESVFVRTSTHLYRVDTATGHVLWSASLGELKGRLCVSEAYVGLRRDKPPRVVFDWVSGKNMRVKPGPCEYPSSSLDAAPNFEYREGASAGPLPKAAKGFSPRRALVPRQGNARVFLGSSSSGVPTPRVGVVTDKAWVWQQDVGALTLAALPRPPRAAVRRESVVVPYWDTQNGALRFSAFRLESGDRMWDAPLVETAEPEPDVEVDLDLAITLDGTVLVRLFDGRLNAYSLQSGKLLWSVGG